MIVKNHEASLELAVDRLMAYPPSPAASPGS